MKKIVLKAVCLILICSIVLLSCNFLFTTYKGKYTYKMINEMYQSSENIDVLFLGSSHAYKSIDPNLADGILEKNTFNCGSSVQGMNTSYHLLKEVIEYHDLEAVFLDTNPAVSLVRNSESSVFYVSDYMKQNKNKYELLKSGGSDTVFNGYVSFRRNFKNINWISNIKSRFDALKDYSSVTSATEEYRGDGFVFVNGTYKITQEMIDKAASDDFSADVPVGDDYQEYLEKIVQLCKEKGIKLVLIEHPMSNVFLDNCIAYDNYANYISHFAQNNEIEYWNFNYYKDGTGIVQKDYADNTHLNGNGAEKYTKVLSNVAKDYLNGKDVSNMFSNK